MLSKEEKKLLKIFKAQVAKEETEYFTVNAYTQLLYDSHKTALNLINRLQNENEEKNKIIKLFEHECRKFKAFCRKLRKDGHDIDLFNQGQEYKCNQFLNLINGESHWDFAGKYFDETNEEIQKLSKEE